ANRANGSPRPQLGTAAAECGRQRPLLPAAHDRRNGQLIRDGVGCAGGLAVRPARIHAAFRRAISEDRKSVWRRLIMPLEGLFADGHDPAGTLLAGLPRRAVAAGGFPAREWPHPLRDGTSIHRRYDRGRVGPDRLWCDAPWLSNPQGRLAV